MCNYSNLISVSNTDSEIKSDQPLSSSLSFPRCPSVAVSHHQKKKPGEYIFTSEAPLHLQSHSSLIFPGTSHSRLIVKDDALAPR